MDERRSYQRFSMILPVEYKLAAFQDQPTMTSSLDISGNGMRFCIKDKASIGEEVHLYVQIPDSEKVLLAAKVVWVKFLEDDQEYEIGVKLADTKSEDGKKFMDFYSQQMLIFLEENKDQNKIE
ncbi:MAG: PilZ domain-containing protein [Candidatus Omnitrophica bacterium]|nr:PilZ domain-containing protein [Candidatus Omnitrophota bacterium]